MVFTKIMIFMKTLLYYSSSFSRRTSSFIGKYLGSKGLKTAILGPFSGCFWTEKSSGTIRCSNLILLIINRLCLNYLLVFLLVPHIVQLLYTAYYQPITLVFKNLDSHRGSLRQAEMPLIDYFLSCGLPKVNNRIRAIL